MIRCVNLLMKKTTEFYLKIKSHYIEIPYDKEPRRIRILLPKDYNKCTNETYPVVYMHDGQNLFYNKESYSGYSWELIPLIKNNQELPKLIIVGIDNAKNNRFEEYTPWQSNTEITDESQYMGGMGMEYGNWVVNTVKPFIDEHYRTKPEREHTLLAGSSLGGLISAYMGSAYPDIFGSLGIFSLASWVSEEAFLTFIHSHPLHPETKVYVQVGTEEGNDADKMLTNNNVSQAYIDSSLWYYQTLLRSGHSMNRIWLRILADEIHFEKFWADHFGEYLQFSFYEE